MPFVTLTQLLDAAAPEERPALLHRAVGSLLATGSFDAGGNFTVRVGGPLSTWTTNGVTITIDLVLAYGDHKLFLLMHASDANGDLPVPDPPGGYYISEPPISLDGSVEDVIGAAQRYLYDIVVAWARSHGWGG